MIRLLMVTVACFQALLLADHTCDKTEVFQEASKFSQMAQRFELLVRQTVGYGHLAYDAYRLYRDSDDLSYLAQGMTTCQELQNQFIPMEGVFRRLSIDHDEAQFFLPNAQIQSAFVNLRSQMGRLKHALFSPAVLTTQIRCESNQYKYRECPIGGRIVETYLTQQHSMASCQYQHSWGFRGTAVWVDRGCRATFLVKYTKVP